MRLHVLSDLHIEHADFDPPDIDADAVILAGDIGVGVRGLGWILSRFNSKRPIVYVPGNHEYYLHDLNLFDGLAGEDLGHLHLLDRRQVTIGKVRFLGTTLWTDFLLFGPERRDASIEQAGRWMNDFDLVNYRGRRFSPEDSVALNAASRAWLEARLDEPFDGDTVVVTHHLPSRRSVPQAYADSPLSPAFASDLEHLMDGGRIALWVHGHTHLACDYTINGTRVLCNPRGYPRESDTTGFRPDLVAEI